MNQPKIRSNIHNNIIIIYSIKFFHNNIDIFYCISFLWYRYRYGTVAFIKIIYDEKTIIQLRTERILYGSGTVPSTSIYVIYRADYSSQFFDNPTSTEGVIPGPFSMGIPFCPISVSPSSSNSNSIMPLI